MSTSHSTPTPFLVIILLRSGERVLLRVGTEAEAHGAMEDIRYAVDCGKMVDPYEHTPQWTILNGADISAAWYETEVFGGKVQ